MKFAVKIFLVSILTLITCGFISILLFSVVPYIDNLPYNKNKFDNIEFNVWRYIVYFVIPYLIPLEIIINVAGIYVKNIIISLIGFLISIFLLFYNVYELGILDIDLLNANYLFVGLMHFFFNSLILGYRHTKKDSPKVYGNSSGIVK